LRFDGHVSDGKFVEASDFVPRATPRACRSRHGVSFGRVVCRVCSLFVVHVVEDLHDNAFTPQTITSPSHILTAEPGGSAREVCHATMTGDLECDTELTLLLGVAIGTKAHEKSSILVHPSQEPKCTGPVRSATRPRPPHTSPIQITREPHTKDSFEIRDGPILAYFASNMLNYLPLPIPSQGVSMIPSSDDHSARSWRASSPSSPVQGAPSSPLSHQDRTRRINRPENDLQQGCLLFSLAMQATSLDHE
jgi:hypothetical protein